MDDDMNDLLNLIGDSIQNLSQCIELFEAAHRDGGVEKLAAVIAEIDEYMREIDSDPIIRLASIDSAEITGRLKSIETDLASIISELGDDGRVPDSQLA